MAVGSGPRFHSACDDPIYAHGQEALRNAKAVVQAYRTKGGKNRGKANIERNDQIRAAIDAGKRNVEIAGDVTIFPEAKSARSDKDRKRRQDVVSRIRTLHPRK